MAYPRYEDKVLRRIFARPNNRSQATPAELAQQLEPEAILSWSQQLRLELGALRANSNDLQEKYKDVPLRVRPSRTEKQATTKGANKAGNTGRTSKASSAAKSSAKPKPSTGRTTRNPKKTS